MDDTQIVYWRTTKDLLAALKARGLPSTWAQIKLYRDLNLIPRFKNVVLFHKNDSPTSKGKRLGVIISKRDMPIFTEDEIQIVVERVAQIKAEDEAKSLASQQM